VSKAARPTPIFQSASGRYYLWAELLVAARRTPNEWWLALTNVPRATQRAVAQRRHPDLRVPDGRLEAEARNPYTDDLGTERCDLFVRFVPTTEGER
jgi:hypothetical protein